MSFYKEIDLNNIEIISVLSENLFYNTPEKNISRGKKVHIRNKNVELNIEKKNTLIEVETKIFSEQGFGRYNVDFIIQRNTKKFLKSQCSCIDYKKYSYKKDYLCKHLVAAVFRFFDILASKNYFKEDKKADQLFLEIFKDKETHKREKVNLETILEFNLDNMSPYFDLSFKIGKDKLYILKDINEFIKVRKTEEDYPLGKQFIYNIKNQYFSEKAENIISFIEEQFVLTERFKALYPSRTSKNIGVKGKTIKLPLENIKAILRLLDIDNATIIINGTIMDEIKILYEDLPLNFKIKEEEQIIIRTDEVLTISEESSVFLYDGNIYIPSYEQSRYFTKINRIVEREGDIRLPKDKGMELFTEIIPRLKSISSNLILDESIKEKIEDGDIFAQFFVDRDRKNILLESKLSYGETDINTKTNKYIIRDFNKEKEINDTLNDLGFIKNEDFYKFNGHDEELFEFLNSGVKKLKKYGEVFYSENFKKYKIVSKPSIKAEIKEKSDYLDFNFDISGIESKQVLGILEAFKDNKKFYKLDDDSFLDLSNRELYNFISLLDNVNSIKNLNDKNIKIEKNKVFYLNNYISEKKLDFIKGKNYLEDISQKFKSIKNMEFEVPKNLKANLREYQVEGYKWFKTLSHYGFAGILADEMGLGKTIQTISFILSEQGKKSLVVTPTALIYNWKSEFEKFAPSLKVVILHGTKREREKIIGNIDEYDVILTTYGTLRNDIESYENINLDIMIIDEAQNIKNVSARTTLAVKNINSKLKFALTGTPIENNLLELWSIFDFIMPNYLYSRAKFTDKFINTNSDYDELKKAIEPFILRREKKEVIKELPDKIDKKFFVELSKQQKKLYASYVKELKKEMSSKDENKTKIEVFSYLMKLRQLCLDPSIVIDNYEGENSKLDMALELIEQYVSEGHKILLFSQFTKVLAVLEKNLKERNIDYSYIDGSVKASDRLDLVNEFNESENKKVFLISLKAGGTGLNLTAADIVIHFDPWWNPAAENQATDRAHRIGQKNTVEVIKLISKGTIEEKILKLQESKKDIIDKVMTGNLSNGGILSNLSEEELINLFEYN
ncbi:DEAD/DEAH box helicase [Clostridium mediterraneense]|uniref:DEAD/DEAH box helicase n=1 Tax=Clostridium mediterraneense TaxID=1805472 RepID=UPI000AD2D4BC|nr:SNF2 helicase associated domain-containing protein [Clostridium mediterraneense]